MSLTMPVRFAALVVDQLGVEAVASTYAMVDPTAAITEIDAFWEDWVVALDACLDGQITESRWEVLPALPGGIKNSPVALSRCTQTGVLVFLAGEDVNPWGVDLPALSNSGTVITFASGRPKINLTPGDPVPLLITLLTTTGSSVLEFANDSQWLPLVFQDSLISFRQRGEQTARRTYQI
jgi:hypothetical protein